jgi:heterodisulfide reductase subunit C/nitrate reductase gamma subunit
VLFIWSFYISAAICVAGILYRLRPWFVRRIGSEAGAFSTTRRLADGFLRVVSTIFSLRIFKLIFSFLVDVVFQWRSLRKEPFRWIMHFSIFAGFILLVLMHALENQISRAVFSGYEPTLNPFRFLRNLFGFMVMAGLAMAVYRRLADKRLRALTSRADIFALVLVAIIIGSGFLLEASKIISPSVFDRMVSDFAFHLDEDSSVALKAYWAEEYNVAFPGEFIPRDADLLAEGFELHMDSCQYCHAKPSWAFVSYPVSKTLRPFAGIVDRIRLDVILWYVHFLATFIGLALLPFTKFFHLVSTPVSLMVRGVAGQRALSPTSAVNRRAVDLDACTHCGECSVHCSVGLVYTQFPNPNILPSERLQSLRQMASNKELSEETLRRIAIGSHICTKCNRCTDLCPSGINLQDMWLASHSQLVDMGFIGPWRSAPPTENTRKAKAGLPLEVTGNGLDCIPCQRVRNYMPKQDFSGCLKCKTCTNACPVVACYDDPVEALGLVPHQIMHALHLGLVDMALDSRMLWDCTTCYLCQEHCPQGVKITDVLYGLKTLQYERIIDEPVKMAPSGKNQPPADSPPHEEALNRLDN